MDVGIEKPFKNSTRHQFDLWLVFDMDKKPRQLPGGFRMLGQA
jgi:hypothetical protein